MVSCWLTPCTARQKGSFCKYRKLKPINNKKDGFCKCVPEWRVKRCVNAYSNQSNKFSSKLFVILPAHSSSAFIEVGIVCENFCEKSSIWIVMRMTRNDMQLYVQNRYEKHSGAHHAVLVCFAQSCNTSTNKRRCTLHIRWLIKPYRQ